VNVQADFEVRSFPCSWDNSGYVKTWGSFWICRSRSSKVNDLGTNRNQVYDFLLVRNHSPILHYFGDIAGFFVLPSDPTLIQPQFWGCSRCTSWPMLGVSRSRGLKLFGREIIFVVFQSTWSRGTWTFLTTPQTSIAIISWMAKTTDFTFCTYIRSIHPNKSPLKNFEKRECGTVQVFWGVPPIISGTGEDTDYKFGRYINRIYPNKTH